MSNDKIENLVAISQRVQTLLDGINMYFEDDDKVHLLRLDIERNMMGSYVGYATVYQPSKNDTRYFRIWSTGKAEWLVDDEDIRTYKKYHGEG